eukprot:1149410-Amphidinium_carterae.1
MNIQWNRSNSTTFPPKLTTYVKIELQSSISSHVILQPLWLKRVGYHCLSERHGCVQFIKHQVVTPERSTKLTEKRQPCVCSTPGTMRRCPPYIGEASHLPVSCQHQLGVGKARSAEKTDKLKAWRHIKASWKENSGHLQVVELRNHTLGAGSSSSQWYCSDPRQGCRD